MRLASRGMKTLQYDPESIRTLFDEMALTYVAGLPLTSADCFVDLMSGMGELWRSLGHFR
jgi:hypothetical protein